MIRFRPLAALKSCGCLLVLLLLVGLAVAGFALLQSTFSVEQREPSEGARALQAALAGFPGRRPYVDIVRRDGVAKAVVHHEREPAQPAAIAQVHGLLWEERSGRLVQVSVPGWMLRVAHWKSRFAGPLTQPLEERLGLEVSLPDLTPFGPGLVVNHHGAHGRRIVVWAEGGD